MYPMQRIASWAKYQASFTFTKSHRYHSCAVAVAVVNIVLSEFNFWQVNKFQLSKFVSQRHKKQSLMHTEHESFGMNDNLTLRSSIAGKLHFNTEHKINSWSFCAAPHSFDKSYFRRRIIFIYMENDDYKRWRIRQWKLFDVVPKFR